MEGGFWTDFAWPTVLLVIKIVAVIVPVVLAMACLTYAERKIIAAVQLRKGPNVVGWFGLLQPIAAGVKLIFKETVIPSGANRACSCWRRWCPRCWRSPPGRWCRSATAGLSPPSMSASSMSSTQAPLPQHQPVDRPARRPLSL